MKKFINYQILENIMKNEKEKNIKEEKDYRKIVEKIESELRNMGRSNTISIELLWRIIKGDKYDGDL